MSIDTKPKLAHQDYPETPELNKLKEVAPVSQKIGEFLDWLETQGLSICNLNQDDDRYYPHSCAHERLLAQFFEIDLDKVEQERRQVLEYVRNANNKGQE